MDEDTEKKPQKFTKFNNGLAYFLNNIFRLFFIVFKFLIKISGVVLITFPFVLFGMCLVAPDNALKMLEALTRLLQIVIDLFRSIG